MKRKQYDTKAVFLLSGSIISACMWAGSVYAHKWYSTKQVYKWMDYYNWIDSAGYDITYATSFAFGILSLLLCLMYVVNRLTNEP